MKTTWLAYIPSPPRGVWHLGPLPIRAYALFIITGIIVALLISDRRFVARGGERGVVYDIALWMVPFGLIGGRLYHLATDWRTYFGQDGVGFAAALRIWDGGLGIWGAVALGAVGAWIGCRRHGIPLPAFLDAAAPSVVLAQAIGRLGNYFNQELYGRETTLPWGLEIFYRRDPAGYIDVHSLDGVSTGEVALVVQPTFLYELIWNLLVFGALLYIDRRFTVGHGRLFGLYVALYCVGRFWVELLRDDAATLIAGIRINSFTSTFVFIGAVVYVILAPKGREDPRTVRGDYFVQDEPEFVEDEAELEPVGDLAAVAPGVVAAGAEQIGTGEKDKSDADTLQTTTEVESGIAASDVEQQPAAEDTEVAEAPEPEAAEADAEAAEADAQAEAGEAEAAADAENAAAKPEAAEPEAAEADAEAAEPEAAAAESVAAAETPAESGDAVGADDDTAEPAVASESEGDAEAEQSAPDTGNEVYEEADEADMETTAVVAESELEAGEPNAEVETPPSPGAEAPEESISTARRWRFRRRNRR